MLARLLIKSLLLPPASILLVAGVGIALAPSRVGWLLITLSIAALWLLSCPLVSKLLLQTLDLVETLDSSTRSVEADAVVILDGGGFHPSTEYGGLNVRAGTLERLVYGVHLAQRFDLPIGLTGNRGAEAMARVLQSTFQLQERWIDTQSATTADNADRMRALLPKEIESILLVSQFWHLPRAVSAFEAAGFDVVPAPTGYAPLRPESLRILTLIPSAEGFLSSYLAIHEWIGRAWYWLRSSNTDDRTKSTGTFLAD